MVAIAVTIVVPFAQAGLVEYGERGRRKRSEREQDIQTFLSGALVNLANQAHADWEKTGVQAFQVRGWWKQRQVRVARVRLAAVASSGIQWGKGKGVIGQCWATRQPQYEDLGERFAPFSEFGRLQWEALPLETRFGLSFDEFQTVKGKYGIIAAVPIVNSRDKYVGCVTADMPTGVAAPLREQLLKQLTLAAASISRVI
jgi:hypothetical protein